MWRTIARVIGCVTVLLLTLNADTWNKKTVLTIAEPIQVPGAILQPGTYVLKLVDSLSDRHIVQILNERENKVYTTILAIPNYRLKPTGDTQFGWWETPAGNPVALRAWFYPGDNFGQEFAYPKTMASTLARASQTAVPSVTVEQPAELPTAPITEFETTGEEKPIAEFVPPATPAPEVITEEAEPVEVAAPEPAETAPDQTPKMPDTASPYPAIAIAAALALAVGLAGRALTNRL